MKKSTILTVIVLAIPIVLAGCFANCSGANYESALKNANAWVQEMGLTGAKVSCAHNDTNGDGYVSCTVSHVKADGEVQVIPIECAAAYTFNNGCRAARVVPIQGQ